MKTGKDIEIEGPQQSVPIEKCRKFTLDRNFKVFVEENSKFVIEI